MSMPVARERLEHLGGELAAYDKPADSGRTVRMLACARCGTKLWNEPLGLARHAGGEAGHPRRPELGRPGRQHLDRQRAALGGDRCRGWRTFPASRRTGSRCSMRSLWRLEGEHSVSAWALRR